MKVYITRAGRSDFVCQAATVADAIMLLWWVERETPLARYRIHHGQRKQTRVVSSAVVFWRLSVRFQDLLTAVMRETISRKQFNHFCENILKEI